MKPISKENFVNQYKYYFNKLPSSYQNLKDRREVNFYIELDHNKAFVSAKLETDYEALYYDSDSLDWYSLEL